MKNLITTAVVAAALGVFAVAPASAGSGIHVNGPWSADRGGDCRIVERRVSRHGETRITRGRQCGGDRRYTDRRYDREYDRRDRGERPGVNLNIGR